MLGCWWAAAAAAAPLPGLTKAGFSNPGFQDFAVGGTLWCENAMRCSVGPLADDTIIVGTGTGSAKVVIDVCNATTEKLHWNGADFECATDGGGAGGGAPTEATYVVSGGHGSLSAEQVLTPGTYLDVDVDTGPDPDTVTVKFDPSEVLNVSWGDDSSNATLIHTYLPSGGANNPRWNYSDGVANLTQAVLREAGNDVIVAGDSAGGGLNGSYPNPQLDDATAVAKGAVQLTNHLSGTASAPTVVGLADNVTQGSDGSFLLTHVFNLSGIEPDPQISCTAGECQFAVGVWKYGTGELEVDTHAAEHAIGGADPVAYYGQVTDDVNGALTQRRTLYFTGAGVVCADDAGNTRTSCTIAGGGGGSGDLTITDGTPSITFDDTDHENWILFADAHDLQVQPLSNPGTGVFRVNQFDGTMGFYANTEGLAGVGATIILNGNTGNVVAEGIELTDSVPFVALNDNTAGEADYDVYAEADTLVVGSDEATVVKFSGTAPEILFEDTTTATADYRLAVDDHVFVLQPTGLSDGNDITRVSVWSGGASANGYDRGAFFAMSGNEYLGTAGGRFDLHVGDDSTGWFTVWSDADVARFTIYDAQNSGGGIAFASDDVVLKNLAGGAMLTLGHNDSVGGGTSVKVSGEDPEVVLDDVTADHANFRVTANADILTFASDETATSVRFDTAGGITADGDITSNVAILTKDQLTVQAAIPEIYITDTTVGDDDWVVTLEADHLRLMNNNSTSGAGDFKISQNVSGTPVDLLVVNQAGSVGGSTSVKISGEDPEVFYDDVTSGHGNWRTVADGDHFYIEPEDEDGIFYIRNQANSAVLSIASATGNYTSANGDVTLTNGDLWLQNGQAIFTGAPTQFGTLIQVWKTDTPGECNDTDEESRFYYDDSLNLYCYCDGVSWKKVVDGNACT